MVLKGPGSLCPGEQQVSQSGKKVKSKKDKKLGGENQKRVQDKERRAQGRDENEYPL